MRETTVEMMWLCPIFVRITEHLILSPYQQADTWQMRARYWVTSHCLTLRWQGRPMFPLACLQILVEDNSLQVGIRHPISPLPTHSPTHTMSLTTPKARETEGACAHLFVGFPAGSRCFRTQMASQPEISEQIFWAYGINNPLILLCGKNMYKQYNS